MVSHLGWVQTATAQSVIYAHLPSLLEDTRAMRLFAFALLEQRPMSVTPFGRSQRFRDRSPQKFGLPPSGDVHVGTRRPTWLDSSGSAVLYLRSAIGAG